MVFYGVLWCFYGVSWCFMVFYGVFILFLFCFSSVFLLFSRSFMFTKRFLVAAAQLHSLRAAAFAGAISDRFSIDFRLIFGWFSTDVFECTRTTLLQSMVALARWAMSPAAHSNTGTFCTLKRWCHTKSHDFILKQWWFNDEKWIPDLQRHRRAKNDDFPSKTADFQVEKWLKVMDFYSKRRMWFCINTGARPELPHPRHPRGNIAKHDELLYLKRWILY